MKKLFLLSSISVFIGLMSLLFCTSQLYAAPPFEVPPKGGLPVCMEDLDLCNSDLGTCDTDLGLLQNDLDLCNSDLDTCNADLAACQVFPGDGYANPDAFGVSGHGPALSYMDNGDGTFTDGNTGLMWEKKDDATGIHDKDNSYTWTVSSPNPDGTLFTVFLDTLNNTCQNDETIDCSVNGDADCIGVGGACGFAGFRDWRIPNIKELQSIVDYSVFSPSSSVPGLTRASNNWSATTDAFGTSFAWSIGFFTGGVFDFNKGDTGFARAVRP